MKAHWSDFSPVSILSCFSIVHTAQRVLSHISIVSEDLLHTFCIQRGLDKMKLFLHLAHLNGFSAVWLLSCHIVVTTTWYLQVYHTVIQCKRQVMELLWGMRRKRCQFCIISELEAIREIRIWFRNRSGIPDLFRNCSGIRFRSGISSGIRIRSGIPES